MTKIKCDFGRMILDSDYEPGGWAFNGESARPAECPRCQVLRVPQVESRTEDRSNPHSRHKVLIFPAHTRPVRKTRKPNIFYRWDEGGGKWVKVQNNG